MDATSSSRDSSESGSSKSRSSKARSSSRSSTIAQLSALLWQRKAWWLVPMVVVFLLVGLLLVSTAGSALSPFIYALF